MPKDDAKAMAKTSTNGYDKPAVSAADDFPAPLEGAFPVELDTGRVIEMVIGELSMLYEAGEIPDELTPIAAKSLFPVRQTEDAERERSYLERLRLAKWVVSRVVIKPASTKNFYHDEIWQIYSLANSPADALHNFRHQQARHVEAAPEMQDVRGDAERTAEGGK